MPPPSTGPHENWYDDIPRDPPPPHCRFLCNRERYQHLSGLDAYLLCGQCKDKTPGAKCELSEGVTDG